MVPIPIELPVQTFRFEVWDGGVPENFEPPDYYRDRPPFLAPAGTKNVAFGKSVSSSAPPVHGELKQITDGDKKYCEHASVVEIPKGVQWVQIDLEYEYQIYAVLFWHFRDNFVYYWDIVVQISNSQDFKEGVADVYNNDLDNTLGFGVGKDATYEEDYKGRLVDAKGVSGRYVRLYSNGNINDGFNHYVEVQVYGLPTDNSKL